jgi:hypothetical protein
MFAGMSFRTHEHERSSLGAYDVLVNIIDMHDIAGITVTSIWAQKHITQRKMNGRANGMSFHGTQIQWDMEQFI